MQAELSRIYNVQSCPTVKKLFKSGFLCIYPFKIEEKLH